MKKIFTLFILSLVFCAAWAKSIDNNTALLVAKNFYAQVAGTATLSLTGTVTNTDASNGVPIGDPVYYVFNVPGNHGFVLVSGDDLVKPILAYSTKGVFTTQNAPTNITGWLAKYSGQILYAKSHLSAATQDVTDQWASYKSGTAGAFKSLRSGAVSPLTQTTWDQTIYYNAMCPADASSPPGFGGNVPTGCGATAMSQIMRYWSYPAQGTGSNSYTCNYGTLSANFGATTYNWANMPDALSGPNTDVATIMYDCGVAVDMNYSADESTSYLVNEGGVPASCQAAYTTYFGYDPSTIQGLDRSNYPVETDWTSLIDNELANNRPIQYAGQGAEGGHTFVLDGSDGTGNYHFNWGWSGADDGFYSIDNLAPGTDDFSNGEQMVIGIQPLNTTVVTTGIDLYSATTVTPDPIAFLTTFTVNGAVVNNSSSAFNGNFCAALFDNTGTFIRLIGDILSTGGSPLNVGYNGTLTFNDTSQNITVPGTYTIGIYYQPTGANTWTLVNQAAFTNPIEVTVGGPTDPGIELTSDIVPSPATFVQGTGASVSVNLGNDGTATFTGEYEAVLLNLQGYYVATISTYTESTGLQAGYDYSNPLVFSTVNINVPEGQYILAIAEEQSGTSNWYYCGENTYTNPILINVINGNSLSIPTVAADAVSLYPNPANGKVTLTSDGQPMTVTICDITGKEVLINEINRAAAEIDISSLSKGVYLVNMQQEGKSYTRKLVVE